MAPAVLLRLLYMLILYLNNTKSTSYKDVYVQFFFLTLPSFLLRSHLRPQLVYTKKTCDCKPPFQEGKENEGGPSGRGKSLSASFSEASFVACSAAEAAHSFSQWKAGMLDYCFSTLKLAGKPHKVRKRL